MASDPAVPAYTVGNLQEGDLTDDCPVFEVHYDGLNVTEIKKLLDVADNLGKMKKELTELNGKITEIANKTYRKKVLLKYYDSRWMYATINVGKQFAGSFQLFLWCI